MKTVEQIGKDLYECYRWHWSMDGGEQGWHVLYYPEREQGDNMRLQHDTISSIMRPPSGSSYRVGTGSITEREGITRNEEGEYCVAGVEETLDLDEVISVALEEIGYDIVEMASRIHKQLIADMDNRLHP